MNITITLEQYEKLRRLSDFADWWIDDNEPSSEFYEDQYASDKEEILQAQEVIQDVDSQIRWLEEQERRSSKTDEWIKQANQDIERGIA
jgi:hypothetical protein